MSVRGEFFVLACKLMTTALYRERGRDKSSRWDQQTTKGCVIIVLMDGPSACCIRSRNTPSRRTSETPRAFYFIFPWLTRRFAFHGGQTHRPRRAPIGGGAQALHAPGDVGHDGEGLVVRPQPRALLRAALGEPVLEPGEPWHGGSAASNS